MNTFKAIERIKISKQTFFEIEQNIRLQEHIRRYAAVRRFIYGNVLDFACGCGYGTFLLSSNPEITKITGIDKDNDSIQWAQNNYQNDKLSFLCQDVTSIQTQIDTLVSLETIEHFKDDTIYAKILENCNPNQIIISYPNKKSTHFNKFHERDLRLQDVADIFYTYILIHSFTMGDVDFLIFIKAPNNMPTHIYANINDLR